MEGIFTFAVLSVVFVYTLLLLRRYSARNTPGLVKVVVFYGWFSCFVIVILLPYDIYLSTGGTGNNSLLSICWFWVYWSIFGLCWILLPVMHSFHLSGEFTFYSRLKHAISQEVKFLLIIGGIGSGFVIYLYIIDSLTISQVPEVLVLMSNIWGLFLIVLMLGYGLVTIPVSTWNQANRKKILHTLHMQIVPIAEARNLCRHELKHAFLKAKALADSEAEDPTGKLREYAEIILDYFTESSRNLHSGSRASARTLQLSHKDLVKLHKEVKQLISEKDRLES